MLLSVIIPSYQHSDYVISCIAAAIDIPVQEKEIFVIDDGSTDDSPEIINKWIGTQSSDVNIQLISHENRGLVSVLNEGLALISGKYVYVVASDDVPIPHGIAKVLDVLMRKPEAGFAMGNALAFYGNPDSPQKTWLTYTERHKRFFDLTPLKRNEEIFLDYPVPLLVQACVFKKSALKNAGGWDPKLEWDDFPLFVKMLNLYPEINTDFIYLPELTVVKYRQHEFNTYKNLKKQVFMIVQTLTMLCPEKFKGKAIARVYARFCFSAIKQKKFAQAMDLVRTSIADHGSSITASQTIFIAWSLIKNRLLVRRML